MLNSRYSLSLAFSALFAASLGAQAAPCKKGPGAQLGIEGYQCANCGWRSSVNGPITYTFFAEPVITQVRDGSNAAAGDVIVAVDGSPITTQAGADRFAYPSVGAHVLTVRRGRDREDLRIDVSSSCGAGNSWVGGATGGSYSYTSGAGTDVGGSAGGGAGVGRGGSAAAASTNVAPTGKFGFAIECRPSCKFRVMPDGEESYTYDGYPVIRVVRPGSAADRAQLRPGDEIINVEGKSILAEAGILQRAEKQDQLHLTVRRDGKDISVVMVVTP